MNSYGWVVRINGARDVEDVVRLYGKLSRTVALFGRVRVLDFDGKAGETFQRLLNLAYSADLPI